MPDDGPPPHVSGGNTAAPAITPAFGRAVGPDVRRWAAVLVDSTSLTGEPQDVLPDPSFDRYARMVQSALRVPLALVTVVESDRQVFPGAAGLPPDLDSERQTPLSHSFCKHVVSASAPLVVGDTRLDPRVSDNLAIDDFGVLAYAGYPITDNTGTVIGSLCALDTEPRDWTAPELAALEDLAASCSTEIALRELRRIAAATVRDAFDVANRARVLLALSERLARTRTLADISRALLRVAVEDLDCAQAGIWIIDADDTTTLRYVEDPTITWPQAKRLGRVGIDDANPFGTAVLRNEPLYYASRGMENRDYPLIADRNSPDDGTARAFLPLVVDGEPFGCLVLLWADRRDFTHDDRVTISALTASTASALQRARLLLDRAAVTTKLQNALLSDLPQPPGIELAARYRPAGLADQLGGDWYDVVELPAGAIGLTIGDVIGHDVDAAAAMGPLRSMLRAFVWDGDNLPAEAVTRLDKAICDLRPGVLATVLFARIEPLSDDGQRLLRWTNGGHPAPILMHADGVCETLSGTGVDCLLGVVPDQPRHDHEASVPSGSTLIMFTDGMIDIRQEDVDAGRARLTATLEAHRGRSADELADAIMAAMVDGHPADDVALLAVRFSPST
jgi:serine phosphatase RsbU (regulator of sigma subunit)